MFDTDTNTIFVTTVTTSGGVTTVDNGSAIVLSYDSNDRFDVDGNASTYAAFEKALSKGDTLAMTLDTSTSRTGSRAVNRFLLTSG